MAIENENFDIFFKEQPNKKHLLLKHNFENM